jgi:hypothetical protein
MRSNLQGYINAQDAVDQIRLSLNSPMGNSLVYVLVEGTYDSRLYSKFFNTQNASVEFVGGGKEQLVKALNSLITITQKVIGICDADFRHIDNDYPNVPCLFFTDCHDIEMTMLHTAGVLKNVLAAYNEAENSDAIINAALQLAEFPAYTRWYNEQQTIKLNFERVKFGDILTTHDITATLNIPDYIKKLNIRSRNKTKIITDREIREFKEANPVNNAYNLCNGHDVTAIITLIIGNRPVLKPRQ